MRHHVAVFLFLFSPKSQKCRRASRTKNLHVLGVFGDFSILIRVKLFVFRNFNNFLSGNRQVNCRDFRGKLALVASWKLTFDNSSDQLRADIFYVSLF